jgi:hypothetical protein
MTIFSHDWVCHYFLGDWAQERFNRRISIISLVSSFSLPTCEIAIVISNIITRVYSGDLRILPIRVTLLSLLIFLFLFFDPTSLCLIGEVLCCEGYGSTSKQAKTNFQYI